MKNIEKNSQLIKKRNFYFILLLRYHTNGTVLMVQLIALCSYISNLNFKKLD